MRGHVRDSRGTAWLVADRSKGDYLCYWYTGAGDAHLVEHARAASAEDAIVWGRDRSLRVRIRTADGLTWWAGSSPTPEGFARTWTPASPGPAGELADAPFAPSPTGNIPVQQPDERGTG